MASCGNKQFCTLCLEDDISNEAVTYCMDCETFLCTNCERHHKRSKASKDHRNVSVVEYESLPTFLLNTSNRCVEHDKRYELYCRFHDRACCVECINDHHKECNDLPLLTDILGNIKSSAAVYHLEKDLTDIKESFDEIEKIVSAKTETLEKQKEQGVVEIKRIRKLINDHLDKLEKQLMEKLSTEYTKLKSDTEKLICKLGDRRKQIDRLCDDFVKMKNFATDLQTFVGSKIIEEMKKEESKYIEGLRLSGELNTTYLEVSMSTAVNSIVNNFKKFGNISVNSIADTSQLKFGTEVREQIPITQVKDITHINPKLKQRMNMPKKPTQSSITGCLILPDGQMLFVDRDNRCLMLFSKDGKYIRDVATFGSAPWDVCYISDSTVAVTLVDEFEVKIVDLQKNKITKSFGTIDKCFGVSSEHRSIILTVGIQLSAIVSIDLGNGVYNTMIALDEVSTCVTGFGNKIYSAFFKKDSVLCHKRNGELLWIYKHEDIKEPRSLSVDKDGVVYVACYENNRVVVLTPDGTKGRVVLSENDGLCEPLTLNFDKKSSTLLVANFHDGCAFLFQI